MNDTPRSRIPADSHDEAVAGRFTSILIAILLAAFVLRVALLVYAERHPARFDFPDSHRYVQVARNIAAGQGPVDSLTVRSGTDPLYPAILAAGIHLGLDETAAILRFSRIVNILCALGSIALLAAIGRHLISARTGLVAAVILAIDPILLFFNGLVLTESLYITLLLIGVYFLVRMSRTPSPGWALAAGAVFGLATLTRSTNLLLPALFLPFVILFAYGHRSLQRWATALFLLGVIACMSPVVVRNYRLLGHFAPVRTGGGASLLEAFGPWADGGPGMDRIQSLPVPPDANEYERDRVNREAAIDWIRNNPSQAVRLAGVKLARTWSITLNAPGYSSPLYKIVGWLTVAPVYLLAIVGAFFLRKRPVLLALFLLPAIYFSFVHMVFVGSVRYRLPAMPFLFLLAGVAVDHLWRVRTRSTAVRG